MEDEINYGDPDKYMNDESIEMAWAIQAADRANIHMNLIMACDTSKLKLNKLHDTIYSSFRRDFPNLSLETITQDVIKEADAKNKWRAYCEQFKDIVDDYALGTLFRIEANKCYSPVNTIVVPKIQYLALETARNVEGINERCKAEYIADNRQNGQT